MAPGDASWSATRGSRKATGSVRPWRAVAVGLVTLLALTGCTAEAAPSAGPSLIGTRTQLCADRVEAAAANAVIAGPVADLRELSTFTGGARVGQCALLDNDGGALLSVQVVRDVGAKALSAELEKLSQQDNYSGDDASGVTGEGVTTTALAAVDADYYVRVLGLGGISADQRTAALALAKAVATVTASIQ
ncbi:MAG: hypothetical protein IPL41_05505 [Micropruina sp.]|nr:hypothetical protein [Micropruina sp.]